jgi:hypothetical protein
VLISVDPAQDHGYFRAIVRACRTWFLREAARVVVCGLIVASGVLGLAAAPRATPLKPVVECEEEVYSFEPANNGAGPMWCSGSTCLVRVGEDVFASGLETLADAKPLNNCRWLLFHRGTGGWKKVAADTDGRTREPAPLAAFPDGRVFLSANPTLVSDPKAYSGPAEPEILEFSVQDLNRQFQRLLPVWEGNPRFTEHSYRTFAADGSARELILFQNIDYTHAEWAFRDRYGNWVARGKLKWPWGPEYEKPEPIRVCYPDVMLKGRALHFCGVSDIVEPNLAWRAFKKQLTGQNWDYDFRRLFYTWTDDIVGGQFHDWIEVASREKTCGWISPGDLWVGPDGSAHLVWTERALDERLREKYFPGEKQRHELNYAVVRQGKIIMRRTLAAAEEGPSNEIVSLPRFQVTPDNRLFVFYYVNGRDPAHRAVSEDRVMELGPDGVCGAAVRVPLQHPLNSYFTATVRGGSPASRTLDLLGLRAGVGTNICYARVRLY